MELIVEILAFICLVYLHIQVYLYTCTWTTTSSVRMGVVYLMMLFDVFVLSSTTVI